MNDLVLENEKDEVRKTDDVLLEMVHNSYREVNFAIKRINEQKAFLDAALQSLIRTGKQYRESVRSLRSFRKYHKIELIEDGREIPTIPSNSKIGDKIFIMNLDGFKFEEILTPQQVFNFDDVKFD